MLFFFVAGAIATGAQAEPRQKMGCSTSECHGSLRHDVVVHGPVQANGCDVCHMPRKNHNDNPINSQNHPLVSTPKGSELNAICLICHKSSHQDLENRKFIHRPILEKSCIACHDPHHSKFPKLLKEGSTETLCLACHHETRDAIHSATVKHDAISKDQSCLNCHQPHTSDFKGLLKTNQTALCLSCHKKMEKWLAENPIHHKPVDENKCTSCHFPHGGNERMLLMGPYSTDFYVHFDEKQFGLCFQCHKAEMVTLPRANDGITEFRNGAQNLHYLHIQRDKKGRSCRMCHEVHASHSPKLIHDWIPFGDIQLPLSYVKTPTGGNCTTACHGTRYYDRVHEVHNEKGR